MQHHTSTTAVMLKAIFHISAGHCPHTAYIRNDCFAVSRDAGFHTTTVMAPKSADLNLTGYYT